MSILVNPSWISELGSNHLACFYALIVAASNRDGLSFETNKYFSERYGSASRTTIQRRLVELEDKGWISRKMITGSKRIISIIPRKEN